MGILGRSEPIECLIISDGGTSLELKKLPFDEGAATDSYIGSTYIIPPGMKPVRLKIGRKIRHCYVMVKEKGVGVTLETITKDRKTWLPWRRINERLEVLGTAAEIAYDETVLNCRTSPALIWAVMSANTIKNAFKLNMPGYEKFLFLAMGFIAGGFILGGVIYGRH
jgi:hypothetical protein